MPLSEEVLEDNAQWFDNETVDGLQQPVQDAIRAAVSAARMECV